MSRAYFTKKVDKIAVNPGKMFPIIWKYYSKNGHYFAIFLIFSKYRCIKCAFRVNIYNFILRIQKMIGAIGNAFKESTLGKAAVAATVAVPLLTSFGPSATAQDGNLHNVALKPNATETLGKPVTLRVGPGFDVVAADSIARVLEKQGCPATVTTERGFPKRLAVEVGDSKYSFKDGEIGDAGATALAWCLDQS